jgi:CRISPR-associated endoribonuclease Cas6
MRIHLKITPNNKIVPFNCQSKLVGTLHKWIGKNNDFHDKRSHYSLSWLKGGRAKKQGLDFKDGASWFISSPDVDLIKKIISNIQKDPSINFGMEVNEISIQNTPEFSSKVNFQVENPVFVKYKIEDNTEHGKYHEEKSNEVITQILKNKLKESSLDYSDITVKFDKNYSRAKTKKILYGKIDNIVNMCPVILEGDPKAIAFAWDVGIGSSTGIGFGSLK